MSRRERALDGGWAALLTLLVLGPVLTGRGYALVGDMVFVPDQPWKDAWLGLDGATPRFVPGEAVVWFLTLVVPGDLVQKALLAAALLAAGLGGARLVADHARAARWTAATILMWNPWVLARLEIGQWPLLVGYAALPWLVIGVRRLRAGGSASGVVLLLGVCAVASPPSGLLAVGLVVLLCVGMLPARRTALVAGAGIVLNLPWIAPALLLPHQLVASQEQFTAFALSGESDLGPLASAVSLGGIWKSSIVATERTSMLVVGIGVVLAGLAVHRLWTRPGRVPEARRLLLGAGLLLLAAVATSLDPVGETLGRAAHHVPALGLLRDSHRLLAPWALVLAIGLAGVVDAAARRARPGREAWRLVAATGCVLPGLLLPSLAWGAGGSLQPVAYPAEWTDVQVLPPATTVVLPWHGTYRGFAWNDRRAMLDPAPRMLPGTVLIDDRHFLGGGVVLASEEPLLGRVGAALDLPDAEERAAALRALGVERAILERGNGVDDDALPAGEVVHAGTDLLVADLRPGGVVATLDRPTPDRTAVLAADLAALATLIAAFVSSIARSLRMRYGSAASRTRIWEGS